MKSKGKKPLSLYLHIPFCVKKCLYCDFLSACASEAEKEAYVGKLLEEMDFWKGQIQGEYKVQTIFIGGGTPTCLSPKCLIQIGEKLREISGAGTDGMPEIMAEASPDTMPLEFTAEASTDTMPLEFTVEANPGTITPEQIWAFQEMGANRISLGLQSAQDAELRALGRIHTFQDFLESYSLLRECGFENINIDLMADIPGQTLQSYRGTLERVLSLHPEHISSYSLIVEEGTPFYRMQQEGKLVLPEEETDRQMYQMTQEMLGNQGYVRYEISNYAKAGKACRHNLVYWKMGEYLGIGLGASSYFRGFRFSNVTTYQEYLGRDVEKLQKERHFLSRREEMEEFVFLGLRMGNGISFQDYQERFGVDFKGQYRHVLPPLFQNGLLAESGERDRIYLTERGIDVSNRVLAEFLL